MTHEIKIWPKYFVEVLLGFKKVEVRKNDRNYQEGDLLVLQEYCPVKWEYTGNTLTKQIDYIVKDMTGLEPDYVILQIKKPL